MLLPLHPAGLVCTWSETRENWREGGPRRSCCRLGDPIDEHQGHQDPIADTPMEGRRRHRLTIAHPEATTDGAVGASDCWRVLLRSTQSAGLQRRRHQAVRDDGLFIRDISFTSAPQHICMIEFSFTKPHDVHVLHSEGILHLDSHKNLLFFHTTHDSISFSSSIWLQRHRSNQSAIRSSHWKFSTAHALWALVSSWCRLGGRYRSQPCWGNTGT